LVLPLEGTGSDITVTSAVTNITTSASYDSAVYSIFAPTLIAFDMRFKVSKTMEISF
jgi:hypothetical protein